MEGIDLALLIQIFKGFKSTLPRPAGFANFRGAGQDLLFFGAGCGSPFYCETGRGGQCEIMCRTSLLQVRFHLSCFFYYRSPSPSTEHRSSEIIS